jgi:hypothetical protein
MFLTKPLKVLVCLAFVMAAVTVTCAPAAPVSSPGAQGDALSADPGPTPADQLRLRPQTPDQAFPATHKSTSHHSSPATTSYSSSHYSGSPMYSANPSYSTNPPPPYAQGPYPGRPQSGLFCPQGMPMQAPFCGTYLPRIGCKGFLSESRLWYATLETSRITWGTNLAGGKGSTLDLHDDLGLQKQRYLVEYITRCQIKKNWGLEFSFMPLEYRDNFFPRRFFFFGNAFYPVGVSTLTQWNRYIYRWDMAYDWFQAPHAVSSLFAGYSLYDDKLTVSNVFVSRSRSITFGLAYAGMSVQKAVKTIGCATASINCKWSVQFLEGFYGWDGYTAGRFSIPMPGGRFAYVEAGWRWIVLRRDYPTNADQTNIDGVIGSCGMVF